MTTEIDSHINRTWDAVTLAVNTRSLEAVTALAQKLAKLYGLKKQQEAIAAALEDLEPVRTPGQQQVEKNSSDELDRLLSVPRHIRRSSNPPTRLRIGDSVWAISKSNEVLIVVANWLISQRAKLPILRNFIEETQSSFSSSAKIHRLDNGLFIEIGDSQDKLLKKSRSLLDACGYAHINPEVAFKDGTTATL